MILCFSLPAQAARIYFEPQEETAGTKNEFLVGLKFDSEETINAISAEFSVSPGLELSDILDGNSIINLWVDKPIWDKNRRVLKFSGIIPGGFSGKKAQLLILKFSPQNSDTASFKFDPERTEVLLNSPDAKKDENLVLQNLDIKIIQGKENLEMKISDDFAPEIFVLEIGQDPNLYDGKYFVYFSTQDKGTGIDHYEINEFRPYLFFHRGENKWKKCESPCVLSDQALKSEISVKALDKKGNERVSYLSAKNKIKIYEQPAFWLLIGIILGLLAGLISWRAYGKKQ